MARFAQIAFLLVVVALTSAQDSGTNYNAGDSGRSETVGPDGEVRGQYSYMDPNGKVITVRYTAGKNGFMVEGDHLPQPPQPQQPAPAQQSNHYNPAPQNSIFNNFPQQQHQPQQQQQQVPYYNQLPQGNNFFQQQQPNFGASQQGQYQPQQYQQQSNNLPVPQLPQLSHNNQGNNGFNNNNYNPFQNQQQQPAFPQQYNNNNQGSRPAKVSVSQQPGSGFSYTYEA